MWPLFNGVFGESPHFPWANSLREWYLRFQDTTCICTKKTAGLSGTSLETVNSVRRTFLRIIRKSKRFYRGQQHGRLCENVLQAVPRNCYRTFSQIAKCYTTNFSGETTFHSAVSRQNVPAYRSENPHIITAPR